MHYYVPYFAQAYGEGAYGEGTYSCTEEQQSSGVCTAAAGTGSGTSPGGLADTGVAVLIAVTLACFILFVAFLVRFWRRPKTVLQEVEAEKNGRTDDDPGRPTFPKRRLTRG